MVRRIADEIEGFVVELGTDGRLLALQLDEMLAGVEDSDSARAHARELLAAAAPERACLPEGHRTG